MPTKRTPLEQAIAEKSDKGARYTARREAEGFKRVNVWLPGAVADQFRTLASIARDLDADQLRGLAAALEHRIEDFRK